MLNEEVRQTRSEMHGSGGADGTAVVIRSERYIVGLRQSRDLTDARNAVTLQIRPENVDDSFAKQILEDRWIADIAAKSERGDGFVGNLADGAEIDDGARFVEPKQMEAFKARRHTRCVAW